MTDYEKLKLAETTKALSDEEKEIVIANLPKDKIIAFLLAEAEREQTELSCIRAILGGRGDV